MKEKLQALVDEFFRNLREEELDEPLTVTEYECLVSYFKLQAQRHTIGYGGQ